MGLIKKSLTGIKKIFLFRVPMNPQKDWKAKLERPHFFKVQPGKIMCGPLSCLELKTTQLCSLGIQEYQFSCIFPLFLIFNIALPVPILQIWPENTANQCKSALQLRQRSQRRRQNSPGNVALQTSFKVRPSTPQCYFLSRFCLVYSIICTQFTFSNLLSQI